MDKDCSSKDCKEINPQSTENFFKCSSAASGLSYACKSCCRKYDKKRREKAKENKKKFKINCRYCNDEYLAAKKKTRFCSRSCGSKWNHEHNENFKKTIDNLKVKPRIYPRVSFTCRFCSKEYTRSIRRKKKTKFCSAFCRSSATYQKYSAKMIKASQKVTIGRIAPNRGVPHTAEALAKISKASLSRSVSYGGVHYKKYTDKRKRVLSLKSSYEIIFVQDYLDENDWMWEYEPKTFTLSNGKCYTPDFYVKDFNKYFEIKGWVKHESVNKLRMLEEEYPDIDIIMLSTPELSQYGDYSYKNIKYVRTTWRNDGKT